jgi:site-specific recombinase XerD
MNYLQQFVNYLLNQKNKPSLITIKNYRADIGQFIKWFELTYNLIFDPAKITSQTLYDYRVSRNLSTSSLKRHTSSLRNFFTFLEANKFIPKNILKTITASANQARIDPWMIRNFSMSLDENGKSNLTIKNYTSDIKSFFVWFEKLALNKPEWKEENASLLNQITPSFVNNYAQSLRTARFSPATVERKLSSLRNYLSWAGKQGLAQRNLPLQQFIKAPVKSPEVLAFSNKNNPHTVRSNRPHWYRVYHSYPLVHYFHFTIVTIFICIISFGLYENLSVNVDQDNAVLGVAVKDNSVQKATAPASPADPYVSSIEESLLFSGNDLTLRAIPGTNGNILIVPDGTGIIELRGPIRNNTNNNNPTLASGTVKFDDAVEILATTGAQAALHINQNSTGRLISANTGDTAKFTLDSTGTGIFAGDLGINGTSLTGTSTNFNLFNSGVTYLNVGGAATTLNLGASGGNTTINSNLILSPLTSKGGILYTNVSGKVFQTTSSSSSDCLTGGENPSFVPCSDIFGRIKADVVNAFTLISDSIIVNGQALKDYIVSVIEDSGIVNSNIISPIVSTNHLSANIISPLSSSDLVVKLASPSGSLLVENAGGSTVAKIDDRGNARFAGTINSDALQANDATISGSLRAKNIVADSILGLDARISNLYSVSFLSLASSAAELSNIPDLSAERAQFNQSLKVFGLTSISDLDLSGRLSVGGTLFITQDSIERLGADLSLQSLRQGGLSIMGGFVYIDTQGNVNTRGDLTVAGKLTVNVISPLSTSDLVINNSNGSSVLSVSQAGDMIASGSGTFTKINFSRTAPVLVVSDTEVIASSSAGTASIRPSRSEITIDNVLVTEDSIIYITPAGTPGDQTPSLINQIPQRSFTVGIQSPTDHILDFNWLIIN